MGYCSYCVLQFVFRGMLINAFMSVKLSEVDGENVRDRPPVHTKTAHFLPADFENSRF